MASPLYDWLISLGLKDIDAAYSALTAAGFDDKNSLFGLVQLSTPWYTLPEFSSSVLLRDRLVINRALLTDPLRNWLASLGLNDLDAAHSALIATLLHDKESLFRLLPLCPPWYTLPEYAPFSSSVLLQDRIIINRALMADPLRNWLVSLGLKNLEVVHSALTAAGFCDVQSLSELVKPGSWFESKESWYSLPEFANLAPSDVDVIEAALSRDRNGCFRRISVHAGNFLPESKR